MIKILYAVLVLGILGGVFGALLAIASKIFRVEVDPKQEKVRACLAGANCGGCGFPGCDGYAAAVARGDAPTNKCVAGGEEAAKKIAEIMGVSADAAEKTLAFVPCSGCEGVAEARFNYDGPQDCHSAMLFGGKSNKLCTYACVGLGSCVKACKFGAMHIENGVAKVDRTKCVGCGACAEVCPKKLITMLPEKELTAVACSSKDKGAQVMKLCKAGCIGCGKCVRECSAGAITLTDNLAHIDPAKCTRCGHCVETCPRKIIKQF